MWHEIFAGSNFYDFSSDPQVPAKKLLNENIFPAKIYSSILNMLWLKFTTQKTELRNRVCSITTRPLNSETKRYRMNWFYIVHAYRVVLFENLYFYYTLIARVLGSFWKLILSKKNQCVLVSYRCRMAVLHDITVLNKNRVYFTASILTAQWLAHTLHEIVTACL